MKICNCCDTVFKDDIFTSYSGCPVRFCGGEVIEIDENLFEVYRLLNEKGYITKYCCSAHSISSCPQTYIQFKGDIKFPKLPTGFKVETRHFGEDETVTNLYKRYALNLPTIELQRQIWATALKLLNWATRLEYLD